MELAQWFFMGVLFTVSVFAFAYLSLLVKLKWYTWASLFTGVVADLVRYRLGRSLVPGGNRTVRSDGADVLHRNRGLIMMVLTWRYLVAPEFDKRAAADSQQLIESPPDDRSGRQPSAVRRITGRGRNGRPVAGNS